MHIFLRWGTCLAVAATVFVGGMGLVSADEPVEGRIGRAELRFLEGMIDHHQMAIDMSNHCLDNTEDAGLLAICQAVIDAQSAEIAQMQAWLLAWYNTAYTPISMVQPAGAMGDMEGMDHSTMNMQPADAPFTDMAMMMGMMAGFDRFEGEDYVDAWLESMIDHHDDAIHMSERLLARVGDAGHAELVALAQAIIDAQSAEIAGYEALLAG
ncbi:MAG: DUF305 domain-containing protein [Pleurocapsa minor GSE-CHR-MK-17-07R]|nr:DUF305 domain-containing protein [Pleurocapsa minor GSE-CHR-MK 17-07R]